MRLAGDAAVQAGDDKGGAAAAGGQPRALLQLHRPSHAPQAPAAAHPGTLALSVQSLPERYGVSMST